MDTETLEELINYIETPIEYDLFLKYLEESYSNEEINVDEYNDLKRKIKEKEYIKNQRYAKPGDIKEIVCYKGYFDKKEKVNVDYTNRIPEFYREALKRNQTLYEYMNETIGIPSKMHFRFILKDEEKKKIDMTKNTSEIENIKRKIDNLEEELKKLKEELEKLVNKNK